MNAEFPKEKLKLLYSDLLRGYCTLFYKGQSIKIKHLTHFDIADFDLKYNEFFEKARQEGVQTVSEREQYLIEEGSWSVEKNKQIKDNHLFMISMKETKAKLFREAEIEKINQTIQEIENKIKVLEEERSSLLQFTAETFAGKKITEYQIFKSFTLNDAPFFSQDEFDNLTDQELAFIVGLYNEKFTYFNERNFKRIALSNFFLNSFYLCKDNPFIFYGKPIVQLTMFQVEIFGHGVYFKHILTNGQNRPPASVMDDPDKLVDWHNSSQSIKEQIDKGKKPEDLVGLTNKDRERLGINPTHDPHKKLIEMAQKKGSALTSAEIMKIQGIL